MANLLLLAAAIILTGLGIAMTINMRLFPNPGDGSFPKIWPCPTTSSRDLGRISSAKGRYAIALHTFLSAAIPAAASILS